MLVHSISSSSACPMGNHDDESDNRSGAVMRACPVAEWDLWQLTHIRSRPHLGSFVAHVRSRSRLWITLNGRACPVAPSASIHACPVARSRMSGRGPPYTYIVPVVKTGTMS